MKEEVRKDLKDTDRWLRVIVDISSLIWSILKEFNLANSYSKGDKDVFKVFIEEYYPF